MIDGVIGDAVSSVILSMSRRLIAVYPCAYSAVAVVDGIIVDRNVRLNSIATHLAPDRPV